MRHSTRKQLKEGLEAVFVDIHNNANDITPMASDVEEFLESYAEEFLDSVRAFVALRL